MPEGAPTAKPSTEDAAHFLVRMANKYPHEVTVYAAGPMTDLALALALDPRFRGAHQGTDRHGRKHQSANRRSRICTHAQARIQFWMDPEASRAVLHARWPRFVLTTVDISVKTRMEKSLIEQVRKSPTPAAQYVAKYAEANYLWDELAAVAWLDSLHHHKVAKNSTLTSTWIAAPATATPSRGLPASNPAWANN